VGIHAVYGVRFPFAPPRDTLRPMYTSVRWINDYLDPPATADEQADLATRAGFPLEGREEIKVSDGTDERQDFEMTSNRGDCVCHYGLAREIAAISGRTLRKPGKTPATVSKPAGEVVTVTNREKTLCPLYTARIIRGVKIGPSPAWLADRLIARGDIPRNNVVDATNFVLFELGQPTHVFDLDRLAGPEIIVRMARAEEPFLPIGEGEAEVLLSDRDLVIADAERAVAIAGVKGGAITAVHDGTTNVLLEAASFDPVTVRKTSRRLGIASDSSYRFERGVSPGHVDETAERLAELILELAGGELYEGVVEDGAPLPEPQRVSMRPDRCRRILGVPVTDEQMIDGLARLGLRPIAAEKRIECTVPVHRGDLHREIDLIEEVGRMFGHDNIPVAETIEVRIAAPQPTERARIAVKSVLVGMGFVETVTHSLVSPEAAAPFLPEGATLLRVDDDRAKAEPVLQPSVIPSLLNVRRLNQDNGVGPLHLFESAATFLCPAGGAGGDHREAIALGLVMDIDGGDDGLRPIRGVVERLAGVLMGHDVGVVVKPCDRTPWLAPAARATANGIDIGCFGRLAANVQRQFGIDTPVLAAELHLARFEAGYPPETLAHALPSFPGIDRDLSPIVDEAVRWAEIAGLVSKLELDCLIACDFVTTFRGRHVEAGRKALTLRLRFRADDRTLRHEEVDPQVEAVMVALGKELAATFRK